MWITQLRRYDMSKKGKTLLVLVALLLAAVSVMIAIAPKNNYSAKLNTVVDVSGAETQPGFTQTVLTVKKDGLYQFSADWWMDEAPGFVTGLIVYDEAGNSVFSVTGNMLSADSAIRNLKKGRYTFRFQPLTSAEAYRAYVTENFPGEEIGEVDESVFFDGTFNMCYLVEIKEYMKNAKLISTLFGVVVGCLLVAIVLVASKKETPAIGKYDERQIAAQGEAFKYGFYTMMVYMLILLICHASGVDIPLETGLQILVGILISAAVLATILIMKDAYFRLDENRIGWIMFFVAMALLNLVIGAVNIMNGNNIADGKLTTAGNANLFCGVVLAYLLIVILVKTVKDRKEE